MKMVKRFGFIATLLLVLTCCVGCDTYRVQEKYPWFRAQTWYCEEIDMTLHYAGPEENYRSNNGFAWTWNDETYYIHVGFLANSVNFGYEMQTSDGGITTLFDGVWEYEGDNLVVTISDDYVFDKKYTKLVFVPQ